MNYEKEGIIEGETSEREQLEQAINDARARLKELDDEEAEETIGGASKRVIYRNVTAKMHNHGAATNGWYTATVPGTNAKIISWNNMVFDRKKTWSRL